MKSEIKYFVILPRTIRDDYINGKLTINEKDVLLWIWLNTNPYNGFFTLSYQGLKQDLRNSISYANVRKIISSLRSKHYIHFINHKGRGGSFPVYPIGFLRANGQIQTEDYLKNRLPITTQSQCKEQPEEQPNTKLENNIDPLYHKLLEQKKLLAQRYSMGSPNQQITTPYNDNDNKNNKKSIIDVKNFIPDNNSYEKQRCQAIATSLGEKDMTFILSCLKKHGLNKIERVWGLINEDKSGNIKNPGAYFNTLINQSDNKN